MGFVLVACGTALLWWTRPARVHVERSARIAAPPERLYPYLADFARWEAWSPWRGLTGTCSSPSSGPGASCHGPTARITIVDVEPDRRVDMSVDFPAHSTETATLSVVLAPVEEGTEVTWSYDSSSSFGEGGLGLLMNLAGRIGHDLDQALTRLAAAVDAEPTGPAETP